MPTYPVLSLKDIPVKYTILHTGRNTSEIETVLFDLELEKEYGKDKLYDLLISLMQIPDAQDAVEGVTIWKCDPEDGTTFLVVGVLINTGATYYATTHHVYGLDVSSAPSLPFPAISKETLEKARLWDGLMFATDFKIKVPCEVDELTQIATIYLDEKERRDREKKK